MCLVKKEKVKDVYLRSNHRVANKYGIYQHEILIYFKDGYRYSVDKSGLIFRSY